MTSVLFETERAGNDIYDVSGVAGYVMFYGNCSRSNYAFDEGIRDSMEFANLTSIRATFMSTRWRSVYRDRRTRLCPYKKVAKIGCTA